MLKLKHKLLSALILAAPLLLNTGIATTVHASGVNNNIASVLCKSSCPSTKAVNCTNFANCKNSNSCTDPASCKNSNCKNSNSCVDPASCKSSNSCTNSSNCITLNGVKYNCSGLDSSILSGLRTNCGK
ncbi:hypothetical protein ACJDU8_16475 [Clostridium sp. WILCCON 0269]|uniref:Secreted protein n=1 Tax=Candidatus Clostridium eludens TaxID=3381663 RepID=A0ABW8SM88_9CLOT